MASSGGKQSFLSGLVNPKPSSNGNAPKIRRFRRAKSDPLADFFNPGMIESLSRPGSNFWKPHPNFRRIAVYLSVYLGVGTVSFYGAKDQIIGQKTNGVLDSVYFCVVTMTTVGYGDLVPNSVFTKLLSCGFVFTGMALGGLIISKAADYLVEKQEMLLAKALYMHQKIGPSDMLKEVETNKLRYKCILMLIILLVHIIVGTIFQAIVEGMGFVDAFYCVCTTITTLGYGDKSFSTKGGRVFAVFYILTGTTSLGQFFLYVAELNAEKRQKKLVKWVLNRRLTNADLEEADIDDDRAVTVAEFIVHKLREMGKISQEDITLVVKEFEKNDVDQSGTLSTSDIILAQNSVIKS